MPHNVDTNHAHTISDMPESPNLTSLTQSCSRA